MGFAFSSMIASFVVVPVEEKEKKVSHQNTTPILKCIHLSSKKFKNSTYMWLQVKHLQFLSGVHPSSYWLAAYAWDILNSLIPITLAIIIFAAFQADVFSSSRFLGSLSILLVIKE